VNLYNLYIGNIRYIYIYVYTIYIYNRHNIHTVYSRFLDIGSTFYFRSPFATGGWCKRRPRGSCSLAKRRIDFCPAPWRSRRPRRWMVGDVLRR
jgi:hypothetical protein